MKRFQEYSFKVTAAAILAVALTLAAPRAVQAVTAALVTVTNTASNPVVAQSVSQLTSQNVMLQASAVQGTYSAFHQALTDGTISGSTFVVPAGESFVVTGIEALPAPVTSAGPSSGPLGSYLVEVVNGISRHIRIQQVVPAVNSTHFEYASGLVFTSGGSIEMYNDLSNPGGVQIYLFGYLTSN